MVNLSVRSYQKEMLDRDDIPFADIRQNMAELNKVNTLLGGHKITIEGFCKLIGTHPLKTTITVCEIGCGGGDNLNAIAKFCARKKINVHFTGIDIKKECIDFAKQQYPALQAKWITDDYKNVAFSNKPDIIFSSLFCHHFDETALLSQIKWMQQNSTAGFFINDLHRNVVAYYSIKWLTAIFSKSYLVKNDAPLSVARGFTKSEWKNLFAQAKLSTAVIQWKWAFRHLIVFKNE